MSEEPEIYSNYIARAAPEIIAHLSNVPSMKSSFSKFVFPLKLGIEEKLNVLVCLIEGLSEIDSFHDWVSKKSEKISEMTKEKSDLVVKLKRNEAETLSNKEILKEMFRKDESRIEENKVNKKELDRDKKKKQKLMNDNVSNEKSIKDDKVRIVAITKQIPFVISEIMFLGKDRNGSEYYFYLRECNRVYVKYCDYVLDDRKEYKIYQGRLRVNEFMKSLSMKGVHERKLYESINHLIKENIFRNDVDGEDEEESYIEQPDEQCQYLENEEAYRKDAINIVMEMEEKFTRYLLEKNYQWGSEVKREEFRFGFPFIEDFRALKEQIKMLHESFLFVEVIQEKDVHKDGEDSESNEVGEKGLNNHAEKETCKKKKPIRIWGINSEKIRKFWVEYLEVCDGYIGIWISVSILKNYVDKYINKKLESIHEQEKKEIQHKEKELKEIMLQRMKEQKEEKRNVGRLRSKNKVKGVEKGKVEKDEKFNGMKTRRSTRNCQSRRPLTIDSENESLEKSVTDEEDYQESEECDICKDIGNVICCDTCPKLFHLECIDLKEIPEGEWSCKECLHKMSTQRQTRSRGRK